MEHEVNCLINNLSILEDLIGKLSIIFTEVADLAVMAAEVKNRDSKDGTKRAY